ncbi:nitrate reductase [Ferriphaselus sp. R-1]|uniref:nitrate reductase n=1 Tax=Ferriphaselus sp. R-1 TaxID=1485544 RepID=UPI0005527865|nr:nitrate reductase [Ferriphaselus sp. R-1]
MMQETRSTCCYCGVGCGVIIASEDGRITGVRGDPAHPANFGRLCSKGSTLHLTARPELRALHPELRDRRSGTLQRVSWDAALDTVADQFAAIIRRHGPDAVGFYVSGQLLTEDYYAFNKLAKGLIATNNIDTNSRLCMSSAVTGYKTTLGMDAPPGCYEDIDHAACLFIAGSNTAYAHPIVFRRIEEARKRNPGQKLIVVDPRRTDTASVADLHLAILPGTDVALFNAMLHVMLWEGWCDTAYIAAHTEGFAQLKAVVLDYTPSYAATVCGVAAADIVQAARWFSQGPTLSLYCQGLNQSIHGTQKNAALINLHLATGQIGKPGAAPLSLTGQPNAMGGREVGGMANLLSGHRNLSDPEHRAEVAALWGVDDVPATPGKTAVEMFEAVQRGEIKALWIACTNPAHSMPDLKRITAALETAELVVVQDAFADTDTAAYADVLLPASTWGEKEGTVTNSERCISRVRAAVPPPGEARHDWQIAVDFAARLAQRLGTRNIVDYHDPESLFNEHRASTLGRDLDIGGLSYALLEQAGPQQWPYPLGAERGTLRLYADGIFPTTSGKAMFAVTRYQPVAEDTDARYPLHLNTGRLRDQWHGMSRTGRIGRLYSHVEEPLLAMHATDMARRGLVEGDLVRVLGRRGQLKLRVTRSDEQRPGQVFLPMHWSSRSMSGLGANALTLGAYDPQSKQPELKHAAVQVEKLDLPWQLVAMAKGEVLPRLERLRHLLDRFDYAALGLYGREEELVVLRAAHNGAVPESLLHELDAILGLDDSAMNYRDAKRGISKRALLEGGQLLAVRLTGETAARDWLKEIIASGADATALRPWLFAPLAAPPAGQSQRGRIVCNCLDVSETEILAALRDGADFAALQQGLKCGTQCGSCVPELKRLVTNFMEKETCKN